MTDLLTVCGWSVAADKYYLSDAYSDEEAELDGGMLVRQLCKRDGRRPAVFLRLRQETNHSGEHTGRAGAGQDSLDSEKSFRYRAGNHHSDVNPELGTGIAVSIVQFRKQNCDTNGRDIEKTKTKRPVDSERVVKYPGRIGTSL